MNTNHETEGASSIDEEYQEQISAAIAAYDAEQIDAWQEMQAEGRAC